MKTTRRRFIGSAVSAGALLASADINAYTDSTGGEFRNAGLADQDAFKLSVFSKCMHWLDYSEMAKVVSELGFQGIDLTVRPEGHVLPERVEQDLPEAINIFKKHGLNVFMITTAITDADDVATEKILRVASSLGVRHYRMGWMTYNENQSIEENLVSIEKRLRELAKLNAKYKITGEYQNHAGMYFGAPIWDLNTVLQKINSPWLGSQYDVLHAAVEGSNSWPIGLKLISPFIKSIDIKDFVWQSENGEWSPKYVPIGEGLVDYGKYLKLIKQLSIRVPISIHYEFPMGGAEHGAKTISIAKDEAIGMMKKDLNKVRELLSSAGLI